MGAIQVPTDPRLFRLAEGDECRPSLLGSHAPESNLYFWPRRLRCPVTRSAVTDIDLSSEGVLYAWTFLYVPRMGNISFGDSGGYGVGQIDLPEGVRIQAPLLGNTDDWQIGSPMGLRPLTVGRDEDGNDLVTFRFEAVR